MIRLAPTARQTRWVWGSSQCVGRWQMRRGNLERPGGIWQTDDSAPPCPRLLRWRMKKPMSLTIDDVAKVAVLARLRVSPDELEKFTGQLNSIVEYVDQLKQHDTSQVEPLAHGIEIRNVFRDDVRGEALPREAALRNAPKRNQESFLVPAVLD